MGYFRISGVLRVGLMSGSKLLFLAQSLTRKHWSTGFPSPPFSAGSCCCCCCCCGLCTRLRRFFFFRLLSFLFLIISSIQFSPVTDWVVGGIWGTIQQRSCSCLFYRKPLWAVLAWARDVHSSMVSIQHFLCRPRRRPSYKVPLRTGLERLSWRVTCPNHASFRLLRVARRDSCGAIGLRKLKSN